MHSNTTTETAVEHAFGFVTEHLYCPDVTGAPVQFLQAYYVWRRHFSI